MFMHFVLKKGDAMKLSKSGIFLIIVLVIAIALGAWVTVMTCNVLAKEPITTPNRTGSVHAADCAACRKAEGAEHICHLHGWRLHARLDPDRARL